MGGKSESRTWLTGGEGGHETDAQSNIISTNKMDGLLLTIIGLILKRLITPWVAFCVVNFLVNYNSEVNCAFVQEGLHGR